MQTLSLILKKHNSTSLNILLILCNNFLQFSWFLPISSLADYFHLKVINSTRGRNGVCCTDASSITVVLSNSLKKKLLRVSCIALSIKK